VVAGSGGRPLRLSSPNKADQNASKQKRAAKPGTDDAPSWAFHMPKLGDSPRSPDRRGLERALQRTEAGRRGDGARLIEARVEDDDESPNK
jgi:hypothetical protein